MSELPHEWSTYARLQNQLARSYGSDERTWRIDDRIWGIEAVSNRLLAEQPPVEEELDRAIRSASRKERYRRRLRRVRLPAEESAGASIEDAFDARERLRRVAGRVTPEDGALLRAVGEGYEYKEIAVSTKVAAGTLRARVLRLRRTLRVRTGLPTLVATISVAGWRKRIPDARLRHRMQISNSRGFAFTPKDSTGASTIRTPAGRAEALPP